MIHTKGHGARFSPACDAASLRTRETSREGGMGACRLLLLVAVWAATPLMAGAQDVVPRIQGSWKIVYKFVEMKGDKNFKNACDGPFPYQYSFVYEICQEPGSQTYTALVAGSDSTYTRLGQTIQRATPDVVISKCAYRPVTQGPAGAAQDWKKQKAPGYPEDQNWQNYRPRDENNRPMNPKTFSQFQLPLKPPYVWGNICNQYDWPDTAAFRAGFQYYRNAWRHENETWIWLQDPRYCKDSAGVWLFCSPAQLAEVKKLVADGGCLEYVEGTSLARASGLPCLLNKLSNVNEETCPYRIEGVSGGTVLYDEQLTGVPRTRDGRTNFCLMYSVISGTITKSAEDIQGNCQGSGGGAGEGEAATAALDEGAEEEEAEAAAGAQDEKTDGAQTPAEGDKGKKSSARRMDSISMRSLLLVLCCLFVAVQRH